jgi:hypothetical protein
VVKAWGPPKQSHDVVVLVSMQGRLMQEEGLAGVGVEMLGGMSLRTGPTRGPGLF